MLLARKTVPGLPTLEHTQSVFVSTNIKNCTSSTQKRQQVHRRLMFTDDVLAHKLVYVVTHAEECTWIPFCSTLASTPANPDHHTEQHSPNVTGRIKLQQAPSNVRLGAVVLERTPVRAHTSSRDRNRAALRHTVATFSLLLL